MTAEHGGMAGIEFTPDGNRLTMTDGFVYENLEPEQIVALVGGNLLLDAEGEPYGVMLPTRARRAPWWMRTLNKILARFAARRST